MFKSFVFVPKSNKHDILIMCLNFSLTSLSPVGSNTSLESDDVNRSNNSDRYLDTILRLDKEHNMFGLSNITIVGARPSKKIRKDEDKAVFHQTAIVQVCCYKQCCRHKVIYIPLWKKSASHVFCILLMWMLSKNMKSLKNCKK